MSSLLSVLILLITILIDNIVYSITHTGIKPLHYPIPWLFGTKEGIHYYIRPTLVTRPNINVKKVKVNDKLSIGYMSSTIPLQDRTNKDIVIYVIDNNKCKEHMGRIDNNGTFIIPYNNDIQSHLNWLYDNNELYELDTSFNYEYFNTNNMYYGKVDNITVNITLQHKPLYNILGIAAYNDIKVFPLSKTSLYVQIVGYDDTHRLVIESNNKIPSNSMMTRCVNIGQWDNKYITEILPRLRHV